MMIRTTPITPRIAPSETPDGSSRTATRHQSAQLHFLQRHRARDERRRLRSGVSARAHDERHEQREHGKLLQLDVEVLERGRREHLAHHQNRQPARALLEHPADRHLHVRLVERLHTAELLDVFRLLLLNGVDDVVDGDDAHQVTRFAHDRNGDEVVVRDDARDLFAVGVGADALHLATRRCRRSSRPAGAASSSRSDITPTTRPCASVV